MQHRGISWRNWFLGLCFIAILVLVGCALGPDFIAALRSYRWKATPCKILRSEVSTYPFSPSVTHYSLKVEYKYSHNGEELHSTRFTTGDRQGSTDVGKAEEAAVRFAPGTHATCYVNPSDPADAVLEHGELWGGLVFLSVFILPVIVMHESIFRWFDGRRGKNRDLNHLPLSERNDALRPELRMVFFGFLGLLIGMALFGFCVAYPLWRWSQSRNWVMTDATVIQCQVKQELSAQHGPEYSLELLYGYDYAGRQYHSGQRTFGMAIDLPVVDLAAWVAAHPVGTAVKCFVDPQHPTEAVLEKNLEIGWVPVALGTLMFGFGILMFGRWWRAWWMGHFLVGKKLTEHCLGKRKNGIEHLRITPPPLLAAIACVFGGMILGAPAYWSLRKGFQALLHWQGDMINLLYGCAAAAGTGWMIYLCGKFLRRAMNPRPVLRVIPGTPSAGGKFEVKWEFQNPKPLEKLRLYLEGVEEAKVRRAMPSMHGEVSEEKTNRSIFLSLPISEDATSKPAGMACVEVPDSAMHSFFGEKCAVRWHIRVNFQSQGGSVLEYKFPITLRPAKK